MIEYGLLASVDERDVVHVQSLLTQLSKNAPVHSLKSLREVMRSHMIFVARDTRDAHHPIIGMATLVIIRQLVGVRGRVEDVVVDEAYRRHGVARMLMQNLHRQAIMGGVPLLALSVRAENDAAGELYRSLGYNKGHLEIYTIDLSKS
ncbi:MAG TPA: GNAT family N-acetyltransferase [Verrucomicrobiae bacterium]|nr:GNAT family N-acetyltransferase [Verrucomicrobiae bacterium]